MKILHVTPHYEPAFEMGGVVRTLSQLCRCFVKLGQDVSVFTTNNNRLAGNRILDIPVNQEVDVGGVKVWYFSTKIFDKKFFYSPDLSKACYENIKRFDLVHLNSMWTYPSLAAGKAAKRFNIPYLISTHGTLDPYSLKQSRIKKLLYFNLFAKKNLQSAATLHYTTDHERHRSHQYNKLSTPSFVVPNPVPLNEITALPSKEEAKSYFSLPQDAFVISFVGRIHKLKALDILIQSFVSLLEKYRNCYLLIAGPDDGYEKNLRQLIMTSGLNKKVKILGFVDIKRRGLALRASDLFWLASHEENFGISAVEAMAAGVPVILSEYVGIYQEVLQDDAGIIVSHNPEDITRKIVEFIMNKGRKQEMSENAKKAVQRYENQYVASLMLKAYKDVLTGQRSPECNWKE